MSDVSHYDAILAKESTAHLRRGAAILVVAVLVVGAMWLSGLLDPVRFADAWSAIKQLSREMFPPDFGRFDKWLRPLADTLAMSIAGTALAVMISLPLGLLAAPNTTPNRIVYQAARMFLNLLRSIPELIMGIIFVAMVGFGSLPGVLALGIHSIGMIGNSSPKASSTSIPSPSKLHGQRGRRRFK
jgi:phosphonate transport system permease protein